MDEESLQKKDVPKYSRRDFLKKIAIAGAGLATLATGSKILGPETQKTREISSFTATLGKKEYLDTYGLLSIPDGHCSFLKQNDGTIKAWIAADTQTTLWQGTGFQELKPYPKPVMVSSGEGFDKHYAAPGSVLPSIDGTKLLSFYHGEVRTDPSEGFPFVAGIGLAISNDGGFSWQKMGQILKGKDEKPAISKVYGAGQPCVITKGDYFYLYYVDWNDQGPDAVHLARSPINFNGMPSSWEKFHGGVFENKGIAGPSTPVILPPKDGIYAALPSVSWNTFLDRYLAVFEANDGFHLTISKDGLSWETDSLLLKFNQGQQGKKRGDTWSSYPSLWSPGKSSDRETDESMILVHSEGKWEIKPHTIVMQDLSLVK